jgi:Ca2+-binding RTX toxin-like protein
LRRLIRPLAETNHSTSFDITAEFREGHVMTSEIKTTDFDGKIIEEAPIGTVMASLSVDGYAAGELSFSIKWQEYLYAETILIDGERYTNAFAIDGDKLVIDASPTGFEWRVRSYDVSLEAHDAAGNLVATTYLDFDPVDTMNDFRGTSHADRLVGTDGTEKIIGGAGDDKIYSKGGDDILYGGLGQDILSGGNLYTYEAHANTFLFKSIKESTVARPDMIVDWNHIPRSELRDVIDLHNIDANTKVSGNQEFDWLGKKAFTGHAGELRYENKSGHTYVYADVNGDKKADFAIELKQPALKMYADDFLL